MGAPPKPHGSRDILGGQVPAYRAVATFRKRHPSASGNVFVQALELCQAAGMVKFGRVALDGTKVRATAWRRRAMSFARMSDRQEVLPEQVSALLAEAERIDTDQDAQSGAGNSGLGLPAELAHRQTRLAKITGAKAALAAEAAERAAAQVARWARAGGKDDEVVAELTAAAHAQAVPKPTAQRNFTDPESTIMKTADGSFAQCVNAQAVVDDAHQVIVANDLNNCAADCQSLVAMTEQTIANTGTAPTQMLADAGYCSESNLTAAAAITKQTGTDILSATGRLGHDEKLPAAPADRSRPASRPSSRWPASSAPKLGGLRVAQGDRGTGS